mgnify:FL=1
MKTLPEGGVEPNTPRTNGSSDCSSHFILSST